jgi:hypothetical protein
MAQLSQRLRDAADKQDWRALAGADQNVVTLLSGAGRDDVLSLSEREALQDLESAHQLARLQCASAIDLLSQRMVELQANREGWLAYALHNNQDNPEA